MMAMMVTMLSGRQHMTAIHIDLTRQIAEIWEYNSKGGSNANHAPWLSKEEGLELCVSRLSFLPCDCLFADEP